MFRLTFGLLAAGALLAATACNVSARGDDPPATIPLDLTGPRPTAQLVIGNAAPVTAIFDTGAAASVLKLEYAQRLGLPNQGAAAAHGPSGAPVQGFRTTLQLASLGGAHFDSALAVALDIPLPLEGVDAIISPSVFSGRVVRFDFAASAAHVLPRTDENIPDEAGQPYVGETTHGQMRRTPGVQITLPGAAPLIAILDTGSAGTLSVPLAMAEGVALSGPLEAGPPQRMVGISRPAFLARLNGNVRIGALTVENPEIRFVDGATEVIVGMGALRNAIIVLDPQGQRSWLLAPER